jgi:hypothetical protein
MNPAETIRKAIEAAKSKMTKRQAKAVRRRHLAEKFTHAIQHATMDMNPKRKAANARSRARDAARGYELWGVPHVEGRKVRAA